MINKKIQSKLFKKQEYINQFRKIVHLCSLYTMTQKEFKNQVNVLNV